MHVRVHTHTNWMLHGWDYPSTSSKQRKQTFIYCIFLLAWVFSLSLLTCLRIQSEFSQPKPSSRILHPHGQKYTHGPSTGWFGRGNNAFLDLYHPWGKVKGINALVSRLRYFTSGLRTLHRELTLSSQTQVIRISQGPKHTPLRSKANIFSNTDLVPLQTKEVFCLQYLHSEAVLEMPLLPQLKTTFWFSVPMYSREPLIWSWALLQVKQFFFSLLFILYHF